MITQTTQDNIDYIMDNFDFAKVEDVMHYMKWEWASTKGVPEQYELRSQVRRLIKQIAEYLDQHGEESQYGIQTCGFDVVGFRESDGDHLSPDIYFTVKFVLTSWDNCE